MRRIGTISSAAGFIFLGIWMMVNKSNSELGDQMLKWWPVLIIILGIEVLINYGLEKEGNKRPRLNLLIVLVIIIFLIVNAFHGFSYYISGFDGSGGFSIDKLIRWGESIDLANYKKIESTKILGASGENFEFEANNGLIRFYKASDNKIKIEADVYVKKSDDRGSYDIKERRNTNGYAIAINEDYIKRVAADIYIPDGYTIGVKTNSSSIKTYDEFSNTNYNISTDSSNIELSGGKSLILNINSGTMKINNVKDVRIEGDSGTINVSGNTEFLDTKLDSGTFNLCNAICKDIKVSLSSGIINVKTKDKNVDVNTELDSGICSVAGERRINAGINKTLGTGEGKVKIELNSGTLTFSSRE